MPLNVARVAELEREFGLPKDSYLKLLTLGERSGARSVSPAGAIGYAQLMPGTARDLGVDPWDEEQNLWGGAKYLAQQYGAFGNQLPLAYAAYNAGPGAVQKYGGIPPYAETQDYVRRTMGVTTLENAGPQGTDAAKSAMMPTMSGVDPQLKAQAELYDQRVAAYQAKVADMDRQLQETQQERSKYANEIDATPPPLPPTLRDIPQPRMSVEMRDGRPVTLIDGEESDPLRVFGQVLPGLAILGSLTMRNGARKAMIAATGAVNAARRHDAEALQEYHTTFKEEMQALQAQNEVDRNRFLDIMEDRRLSLSEKVAKLQTLAAQEGNIQARAQLAEGDLGAVYKGYQMRDQLLYRAAMMQKWTDETNNDRERRKLDQRRTDLMEQRDKDRAEYNRQRLAQMQASADKKGPGQLAAQLLETKQKIMNDPSLGTWTAADEQTLRDAIATAERMQFGALEPVTGAPGGSSQPPAANAGPVVTNGDVSYLKANDTPAVRAAFDKRFGAGAARKYLGH